MIEAVKQLVAEERLGALATVVEGSEIGTKAVIDFDTGFVAGELPAEVADDVLADARELMAPRAESHPPVRRTSGVH